MSKNGLSSTRGLWIVALSAVAGFAAVYGTLGGRDNAASQNSSATSPSAQPKSGTPTSTIAPSSTPAPSGQMAAFVRKSAPQPLPDISFQNAANETITLSTFKGRTVLLNLWATWCAPCREEMPSLNRLQQSLGGDDFEVIALSLDRKGAEASKTFLDEVKATALQLYTDKTAKQGLALKLIGMPTTILIDAEGREVGRLSGPAQWDSDEAKELIRSVMKKPDAGR